MTPAYVEKPASFDPNKKVPTIHSGETIHPGFTQG